ncbi:MAG: hypothetical protein O2887_02090 [Bacteroidetes bacterium]|nr:hypothetical protein [Bacteroidota bacterium]MDA1119281.1 hypothetical protein [Bacteroidota bacterium]
MILLLTMITIMVAQPPSDIYLFDIDIDKGKISNPINVTKRKNGYDNQPYLSRDGQRLYFTRSLSGQTDIYYYDLKIEVIREFSFSPISEYYAKETRDGKFISFVLVGEASQELWKMPREGGEPIAIDGISKVENYSWIDDNQIAVIEVGEPNLLKVVNFLMGNSKTISSNVGRGLQTSGGFLFFVQKESGSAWWIKRYDPITGYSINVLPAIENREDFFVTASGMILMTDGRTIFYERKGKWRNLVEIEMSDFYDFDRILLSEDEKKLVIATKN